MAFRATPQLGPGLDAIIPGATGKSDVWFDIPGAQTLISPRLGTKETGSDGHDYVLVQASATITAGENGGTQIIITEPGFTAAAGSGGFYAPEDREVPDDGFFWARKGAL